MSALCLRLTVHRLGIQNKARFPLSSDGAGTIAWKEIEPSGRKEISAALVGAHTRGGMDAALLLRPPRAPEGHLLCWRTTEPFEKSSGLETHTQRANKQEQKVTVSKYQAEGPWSRLLCVPCVPLHQGCVSRWHPGLKTGEGMGPGKHTEEGEMSLGKEAGACTRFYIISALIDTKYIKHQGRQLQPCRAASLGQELPVPLLWCHFVPEVTGTKDRGGGHGPFREHPCHAAHPDNQPGNPGWV